MKIGHGVLGWEPSERITNRYGAIQLVAQPFNGKVCTNPFFDEAAVRSLIGLRVKLTAHVLVARTSGHAGDQALKIKPSTPEVGERMELGVGILAQGRNLDNDPTFVLMPTDDRKELWIDPRILYRLHDQTVDLYAEPTTEPCSPVPDIPPPKAGIISNGDGSFQAKKTAINTGDKLDIPPRIERLGDGMFAMSPGASPPEGEYVNRIPQK